MSNMKNRYYILLPFLLSNGLAIQAITYGELLQNAYNSAKNYMTSFYETAQDKVDKWKSVLREPAKGRTLIEKRKNLAKKLWNISTEKNSQQGIIEEREAKLKRLSRGAEFKKNLEALNESYKIKQSTTTQEQPLQTKEQEAPYLYAVEAFQNGGPVMDDSNIALLSTSDRHVFKDYFWGIFHGKLAYNQVSSIYNLYNGRNQNASLRESLISVYADLIKQSKKNNELGKFGPSFILKGVIAAIDADKIALAISPTFGAFILRDDTIIYAYEFDQKKDIGEMTLQNNDLIFLCSPGLMAAYPKVNRYAKITEKWFAADTSSKELFQKRSELEEKARQTEANNIRARLERQAREILPLSNNVVVRIGEENSNEVLRAQLYCMLQEVQKIVRDKNLSCVVIKVNKKMTLEKPIILDSAEVLELCK